MSSCILTWDSCCCMKPFYNKVLRWEFTEHSKAGFERDKNFANALKRSAYIMARRLPKVP